MSMAQATFQDIDSQSTQCTLNHLTIYGLSLFHPQSGQTLWAAMDGAPLLRRSISRTVLAIQRSLGLGPLHGVREIS